MGLIYRVGVTLLREISHWDAWKWLVHGKLLNTHLKDQQWFELNSHIDLRTDKDTMWKLLRCFKSGPCQHER